MRLRSEGGIKALLGMVRCRHPDVLSQVARGIANFAKCESRASGNGKFPLSKNKPTHKFRRLMQNDSHSLTINNMVFQLQDQGTGDHS